ncbi:FlxA-like family protein [Frigoribacterium sp. RIT-PI-h]|uniref:FlxA-like family protein n=1 Tax=Frigoribacterium sp. RIT-PI-h TaxID=1690245 RepID=UPI000A46D3DF|nr:FlxA-like family protein [Frigoribacterium sp. RIT-PI-h]
MEILYVTHFKVTLREDIADGPTAMDRLVGHAAHWLVEKTTTKPDEIDLTQDGSFLRSNGGASGWELLRVGGDQALKIVTRQPASGGTIFESRITLANVGGNATARVSLGRESTAPGLFPAPAPAIRQPTFVLELASDDHLSLAAEGAVQDGRYLLVQSDAEARAVSQALQNPSRIPIIVMHPQGQAQWDAAKIIAKRLIGLVRVVVAGYRYTRLIEAEIPSVRVPFGGAVLAWSRLSSPPLVFVREELEALGQEGLRSRLMALLADLSVRARGADVGWAALRQLALTEGVSRAAEEADRAASDGDLSSQIAALQEQASKLKQQLDDAELLTNAYARDADAAKGELEEVERERNEQRAKADNLQAQIQKISIAADQDDITLIDDAPILDSKNAEPTYRFLEEASEGRITFTPNALSSWRKASLSNNEQMTQALIGLSRWAMEQYGNASKPKIDGRLDDWIEASFGIAVSFHDSQIETHHKADAAFHFEGKGGWNNVPHVKVTDAVPWPQVARIHFAQDETGGRIIVNHVGHKLYK